MGRRKSKVKIENLVDPINVDQNKITIAEAQSNTTEQPKGDDKVKSPPGNIR